MIYPKRVYTLKRGEPDEKTRAKPGMVGLRDRGAKLRVTKDKDFDITNLCGAVAANGPIK